MFRPRPGKVMDDVAAASAAYMVNLIPALAKLTPGEALRRLHLHFTAALLAYRDNARRVRRTKAPKPSRN